MLRRASKTTDLRAQLNHALRFGRLQDALDLYELIEARKPEEPRWPHRRGDLLLRMERKHEAAQAYERAVTLYMEQGFDARAAATAKIMLAADPSRQGVLEPTGSSQRGSVAARPRAGRTWPRVTR